jgi:histidine kinase
MNVPAALVAATRAGGALRTPGPLQRVLARVTWRVVATALAIAVALGAWSMWEFAVAAGPQLPPGGAYLSAMIVNVSMAFAMLFTTFVADELAVDVHRSVPIYGIAVVAGSVIGTLAQWQIHRWLDLPWRNEVPGVAPELGRMQPAVVFLEYLIWGAIIVWIYVNRRGALRAAARMNAAQVQRAELSRRTLQARLATLQAQVEPRFLLETLARVSERYEQDPAKGSEMLGRLIVYLRAALPRLRESTSTLAQEIALARAYVDVMRAKVGEDVALHAEVSEALRTARMPPMIMLPLVTALLARRGAADTAAISVTAQRAGDALRMSIADGAGGFSHSTDGTVDDIRQRLHALYGERGRLTFDPLHACGAAIVEIPYEATDGHHR